MAEEKLTNQDLVEILIKKHGLAKEDAETFIKEFFLLIEEALQKDKIAKVKGLGTFKLTEVKSRESINVNTGERFEIQEHTKVTFTPDPLLRDLINKPFAHFETIILNDGVTFDDEPEDDNDSEQDIDEIMVSKITPDTEITQVTEISIGVIPSDFPEETPAAVEEAPESPNEITDKEVTEEETITPQPEIIPTLPAEPEQPTETEPEEEETASSRLPLEEIIARELEDTNRFFNKNIDGEVPEDAETAEKNNNSRPSKKFMIITIVLAILVCGTALLFTYFPTFMDDLFGYNKAKKQVTEVVTSTQTPAPVPAITDTISQITENQEEPKAASSQNIAITPDTQKDKVAETKPPVQTSKPKEPVKVAEKPKVQSKPAAKPQTQATRQAVVYDNTPVHPDSTSYNIIGTKATHTIQSGETLTRVSLRYYGTKDLWPYLVMHNRSKIPNPGVVPAGLTINIPELEKK